MAAAASGAGARARRPVRLLPEPERFWIRFAPRAWPAAPSAVRWIDLAHGVFGRPGDGPDSISGDLAGEPFGEPSDLDPADLDPSGLLPDGPFDDVLYVPPVAPELRVARDRALAPVLAAGTPVVVQILPGEPAPGAGEGEAPAGAVTVVDLSDALLAGDLARLDRLESLPPGSAAVWPLVAGLTDDEALWAEGLDRLAGAGLSTVQPVVPELAPAERRLLAEGRDERVFDALFHGRPPDPRELARAAAGHGLPPFLPRPLPRPPLAGAPGREIGGLLLLAGELCQRLGRHGRGQAHFRAARWIDRSRYDLRVLVAEGNLPVIPWLDPASREIVEEWARTGRSATVDALVGDYAAPVG